MKLYRCLFLILFVLISSVCLSIAEAQVYKYRADNSIRVSDGQKQQTMAWSGGVNNPQFALADLNHDGQQDLVIYEQETGVKTFINSGTNGTPVYRYTPAYEQYFPQVNEYLKLIDYNNDGISDLIHRGQNGFSIYRGYYEDNKLKFTFYKDLFYQAPGGFMVNAYCEPNDIPGVADVDGDGDLDFFSYYIGGGYISFYKNCRVEQGLPADSIIICLSDNCWGKVFQPYERTQHLGISCSSYGTSSCKGCEQPQQKTTHSGNTLCLLDYNSDGDYDYFNGNNAFPDIQLLTNGKRDLGYPIDTIIAQDTLWGSGSMQLKGLSWPSAFWLDVDGDGDKDLLFSPHARGSENYRCIAYYKNTGSSSSPIYTYQSDTFLIDQMMDFGTGAYPVLYDYNRDGKLDLFVGNQGYYQSSNGTFRSRIAYYQNTSTGSSDISFTLITKDFLNLSTLNITGAIPAIGDIDGDGKDDLLIGKLDGKLLYFHNQAATAAAIPDWQQAGGNLTDDTGAEVSVGGFAAPCIYDIDKDGHKDLILGNWLGTLVYYHNNGSGTFKHITDTLGGVKTAPALSTYGYSVPFIGRIDNTGTEYLLLGSQTGELYRYDGFQNGHVTGAYTRLDSAYQDIPAIPMSAPAVADLDGDGHYEILVGNTAGGIKLYRWLQADADDGGNRGSQPELTIYPNPASNKLNIKWNASFAQGNVSIVLLSVTGQKLIQYQHTTAALATTVDVSSLSSGIYYCIVISGTNRSVKPVSIIR